MTDTNHDAPPAGPMSHPWLRPAKTFFWVTCVTVLIWVYADLEKTETEEFHVKLVLSLGESGNLVFQEGPNLKRQDLDVVFRASGSRNGLDRCRRALSQQADTLTADLSTFPPGDQQVPVADFLRRAEAVRDAGLTIVSANPAEVPVNVDRALHVDGVEVRFRSSGVGVAEATVQPPTMGLSVAKPRWDKLMRSAAGAGGGGAGKPFLETVPVDLQSVPAESNKPLRVAVAPFVSDVPVLPDQAFVQVELRVAQMTDEKKLNIAVRIETPPLWTEDDTWQRFVLKRKDPMDWQKELTFRGPKKEIEKLSPEGVDAYVVLREDDKTKTDAWLKRDVEVRLPRDSQIQVVGEKPSVEYRLDPRTATLTPP